MARKADPANCAALVANRLRAAAYKLFQARRTGMLNWSQFTPEQKRDIEAAWRLFYQVERGELKAWPEEAPGDAPV